MSDEWETVVQALAAKCAASTVLGTAGLRKADTDLEDDLTPPHLRILGVIAWELMDRPNAYKESYRLTIAGELAVDHPDGIKRSRPIVMRLARAMQVEFQSGIKAGLPSYVVEWRLESFSYGLEELADTEKDGGRFIWVVDVDETLSTPRTA